MMTHHPLNILMVASEAAPFAKTGGLADVVGALPQALQSLGHNVRLVMPYYRAVRKAGDPPRKSRASLCVPLGGALFNVAFRQGALGQVPVSFIDVPELFDRPGLYGEQGQDYPDNDLRFGLLGRAALELARKLDFAPDIVHAHDWQTGLVPVYLDQHLWRDPFFAATGSLFTIHNLGYQGLFAAEALTGLGLDTSLASPDRLEYFGRISLLKGGIRYADRVSTVSPTYCREIQTKEKGMGLDGLLAERHDCLHGILNGLDTVLWNPANDDALTQTYSAADLRGKKSCKAALQKDLALQPDPNVPIVAMVTRLDPQKGIDLVLDTWHTLLDRKIQLVILGSGTPAYEQRLTALAEQTPGRVAVSQRFDDRLARRIYAGSDLFLMPSLYEPCGLGQLIALRYGSVPLVRATGGLADTIIDPRDATASANGFHFREASSSALIEGLDRALASYRQANVWRSLQQRGMQQDVSWRQAATSYTDLYRRILSDRSA